MKKCYKPGHRFQQDGYGEGICWTCLDEEEKMATKSRLNNEDDDEDSFIELEVRSIRLSGMTER